MQKQLVGWLEFNGTDTITLWSTYTGNICLVAVTVNKRNSDFPEIASDSVFLLS